MTTSPFPPDSPTEELRDQLRKQQDDFNDEREFFESVHDQLEPVLKKAKRSVIKMVLVAVVSYVFFVVAVVGLATAAVLGVLKLFGVV